MVEILIGFVVLVIVYRIFPSSSKKVGSESTILPFVDDDWSNGGIDTNEIHEDWEVDSADDFDDF